jgi:hypothetical protein
MDWRHGFLAMGSDDATGPAGESFASSTRVITTRINHARFPIRIPVARHTLLALVFARAAAGAAAADAVKGIEQALLAAQQDGRGITLYVNGHAIEGAVTRVEPGQWVEMKNRISGKIIVRIDRIDGIAAP